MTNHIPVLLTESTNYLNIKPDNWYIDCTFGGGGHSQAILEQGAKVLALDWDESAITSGKAKLADEIKSQRLILIRSDFADLNKAWSSTKIKTIPAGILFDFGTSTDQLMSESRGFSFTSDSVLDMRMDTRLGVQAKDLLAVLTVKQLSNLFEEYGGEEEAHRIALSIKRAKTPIITTKQLANLVSAVKRQRTHLHSATKVFQALRIAVNLELDSIKRALPVAFELLQPGGRIVTLSFHEGEDSIVKHQFNHYRDLNLARIITPKPITPTPEEISRNPRSRSSKLRTLEKI